MKPPTTTLPQPPIAPIKPCEGLTVLNEELVIEGTMSMSMPIPVYISRMRMRTILKTMRTTMKTMKM
jgi:hypothetical protein